MGRRATETLRRIVAGFIAITIVTMSVAAFVLVSYGLRQAINEDPDVLQFLMMMGDAWN